jgi:hypothetical protein
VGEDHPGNEEASNERICLQSQIDHHMMLNKIWKKCNNNNNIRSGSSSNNNYQTTSTTISFDIYPDLIEKLARKPLLLFLFLQKYPPQLFTSYYERSQNPRRRRSTRIMKKRRIGK